MSIVNVEALENLGAVLWWPGSYASSGTTQGFLIIPSGVTATPAGTFTTVKGKDGRDYWVFDGSTNYITLTDHTDWSMFLNDFSIVGWAKFTTIAANKLICGQYVDANNQWYLVWTTSNVLQLYGVVSGTDTFNYSISFTPTADTWFHFAIVRDTDDCLMYIDAESQTVTETTAFSTTETNIASTLNVGGMNSVYMLGNLKDFQILPGKALSQDQLGALYKETYIY